MRKNLIRDFDRLFKKQNNTYIQENKEILLELIMEQLEINDKDLDRDTDWMKAKIRDYKINNILR